MPFVVESKRNFRWGFIKNEYLVRLQIGDFKDWFIIDKPAKKHDANAITNTVNCSHVSQILKTKNIYTYFDDNNGIDTMQNLLNKGLTGTGWTLGEYDTMVERDGETEKIRSYKNDGKTGAFKIVTDICGLFNAYPIFDGENKQVNVYAVNNKGPLREMTIGKDISALTVNFDSSSVITRLYVEGDYDTEDLAGDIDYIGIDDYNNGVNYLTNFDYYKEIGLFTDEHQELLDRFNVEMPAISEAVRTSKAELERTLSQLNSLWGQCSLYYYVVEHGEEGLYLSSPYKYGTPDKVSSSIQSEDEVVIVSEASYRNIKVPDGGYAKLLEELRDDDIAVIKYAKKASGTIGGKEVGIETNLALIENLEKKLSPDSTIKYTEKKRNEFLAQINMYEKEIYDINHGIVQQDFEKLLEASYYAPWLKSLRDYGKDMDYPGLWAWYQSAAKNYEAQLFKFNAMYPDLGKLITYMRDEGGNVSGKTSTMIASNVGVINKETVEGQYTDLVNGNVSIENLVGSTYRAIVEAGWTESFIRSRIPDFDENSVDYIGGKRKIRMLPIVYRTDGGEYSVYNAISTDGLTVYRQTEMDEYADYIEGIPDIMNNDATNRAIVIYSTKTIPRDGNTPVVLPDAEELCRNAVSYVTQFYYGGLPFGGFANWIYLCAVKWLENISTEHPDINLVFDENSNIYVLDEETLGRSDVPGLYELYPKAAELFLSSMDMEADFAANTAAQTKLEKDFEIGMGDLLKDGYWNDDQYSAGQEEFLYKDALDMMEQMSKPKVTYSVSRTSLSTVLGVDPDDLKINMRVRIYDPELGVNDMVYISSVTRVLDDPKKDAVTISNEDITLTGSSLAEIMSRLTDLADMLNQKNSLYSRAAALSPNGTLLTNKLEGRLNVMANQLSSTSSGWYTDERGNIIFESADGTGAMMLCGQGFMIAYGKKDDGTWNWRTCGTGKGLVADEITTGYLSADRIEAGSITVEHLMAGENGVGATIDLSQNGTLTMAVQNNVNAVKVEMDATVGALRNTVQNINNEVLSVTERTTTVEQTAKDITTTVSRVESDLTSFEQRFDTYQRFDETGMTIGKMVNGQDTGMQLHLAPDRLSFRDGNEEVAYMSNSSLYITEAKITDRLSIAVLKAGYFDWVAEDEGLGLRWREGSD